MSGTLDCTDVDKLVQNRASDQWEKFQLVYRLTIWELGCLNEIKNSQERRKYPKEQEEILIKGIKRGIINVKPDLIRLDVKNLKYIGVILQDYKVGGNLEFNKFLVKSLLESYGSIASNILKKLNQKSKKKLTDGGEPKWKLEWKKTIGDLVKDRQIEQYYGPKSTTSKKPHAFDPKVEQYLELRKDVDSLYTIISKFDELKQDLKQTERSTKEYNLALQRLFHIAGEYLKDTQMTPNLSAKIRESLMDQGVPVKVLNDFRDMLAHYQLYPLIDLNNEEIENLLEKDFQPIKKLLEYKISELEENYIRGIIEQKLSEIEVNSKLKPVFEKFMEDSNKGVGELLKSIKNSKSLSKDVAELYQNALQMKSKDFSVQERLSLETNVGGSITDFIIMNKLKLYGKLHEELVSWKKKYNIDVGSVLDTHEDVLGMIEVMDHLSYGGTPTSKDILEQFIGAKEFDAITIETDSGESTLKKELNKYFDPNQFSADYDWSIPKGTTLEHVTALLQKSGGTVESKKKLWDFLKSRYEGDDTISLTSNEYKSAVDKLKLDKADAATLHSFSVEWKKKECARLIKKHYSSDLKNIYDAIIQGDMGLIPEKYKPFIDKIVPRVEELYNQRVKEEINVLDKLKNPNAVESQIINIYSLLDNAQGKPMKKMDGSGERTSEGAKESSDNAEGKEDIKKFRNYLSHGDALTSIDEQVELSKQLVSLKDNVVQELRKVIDSGEKKIDIPKIENIIDGVELSKGILNIRNILCPRNSRTIRYIKGCLTWEDVEKVVDGEMETLDPDIIKINSEKLMSTLSSEMDEEKFYNYIALAGESEVEGVYKNEVTGLITHHETYIKHLEKVGKFSGNIMHGMIAKDILGALLRGDYKGVAVDVVFFTTSVGLAKAADIAALKGAGFAAKGRVVLGRSLKLASPFLSRGVSAFVAYDLWNQVKELKSGNKDALVSVVGDSIQLGVDAVEMGIEIAEGLSLVEGISATTGPIGMAIGATIFVGVEVYKAVRAVEKIEEKIRLTGWERFVQGLGAFVGVNPSEYLRDLMEEKDGNNAAVQNAIKVLKGNPHIQRYVFPSYVHVDGKLISALNSVVYLSEKVNNIKWTRSRPDDVAGINLFCKPKGEWEPVPETGTYLCENAIGVEYTDDRTGNYTLINLGEGEDRVKGFQDSGNIFIIDQACKTMFGGSKDDNFLFHTNAYLETKLTGSIDGLGGQDMIDVGGLPVIETFDVSSRRRGRYLVVELTADFLARSLKYGDKVDYRINNINKFQGMAGNRDRVVAACDTLFVDGRGGGEEEENEDEVTIPAEACSFNTTVTVGINTSVNNVATAGTFKYFISGEKGENAYVNLRKSPTAKNTLIFRYTLKDIAAINRSEGSKIKFSFVEGFYENFENFDYEHSFNVTVSGVVEENTYLLSDNTRIVVGKNNMYALQNIDKPIDQIVEEYYDIMSKLQMIAVVHSNNEVLTIGGPHNDVINNDPSAEMSHFVSGAGENIFSFSSGQEKLNREKLPMNDAAVHYFSKVNSIDTLDLRKIKEQVKKDLGSQMEVAVSKYGDDLMINLFFDDKTRTKLLMKITLKDVLEYLWYSKIRLMMDTMFAIEEFQGEFRLVPQPLIFDDKSDTLYVINPRDVVEGGKVKVAKELGSYVFVRDDDALIITNSLSSVAYKKYPLATVILNDFYNVTFRAKMETLEIKFDDKTFVLNEEMNRINDAQNFVELKQKVKVDTYEAMVTAMKRTRGLFEAIDQGKIQEAKRIIDENNEIISSKDGWLNPLVYAANKGELEIVKYLANKGADVKLQDSSGHTPVYYAVRNQHLDVADFLLSKLFPEGDEGMIAITAELAVVKYIVEMKGSEYVATSMVNKTSTLLHYAAINGNLEVVKYLDFDFRAKDRYEQTPLYYAVKYRHADVVDYFGELMREEGHTLLCFAAQIGRLEIVKYLIDERGADIYEKDISGGTPLYYAILNVHREIIDYLSNIITKEGEGQLLAYPSITNDLPVVGKYLIEKRAAVNGKNIHGKTPLHYAVIYCNLDMVTLLIDKGAYLYAEDSSGHTPFHYALAQKFRGGVVSDRTCNKDALLSALLVKDDRGVLVIAAEAGELQIVKHMIETGADPEITDYATKQTLVHIAAIKKQLELMKYLIERGLDPNAKDNDGRTPLHYAAVVDGLSMVKYLVEHGADVNLRDKTFKRPIDYARGENLTEKYLEEKMNARKRRDIDTNQNGLQDRLNSIADGNAWQVSNTAGLEQSRAYNNILSWVKSSVSGFLHPKTDETQKTSFSGVDSQMDANGTIMLLDLLIRKVTGQKYDSTVDRVESPLETQGYALNVVELFEEVLNETALELGIPTTSINFDPIAMQSAVIRHRRHGKTSEIPKILYSYAKKACPEFDQSDEFLEQFRINLEQVLEEKNELLQPKIDQVSYPMFSNKYGVVVRAVEADLYRKVGDYSVHSLNGTSDILKLDYA